MSLHDAYARMTPFEIAFPDEGRVGALAAAVVEEASSRRVDPELPGIFITLGAVDDFVSELRAPDESDGSVHRYGPLVFQAVHFVRAGRPVYLLETPVTRQLVKDAPAANPQPPAPAGYLQLPQHLFWMGGPEGSPPESLDGLFWFVSGTGATQVLPITGMLPDRPGFRAVPLPEAPFAEASQWLSTDMRRGGADYENSLPGHDLDGLFAVETAGEVLKLLARFFAYVEGTPGARCVVPAPSDPHVASTGPVASALPYTRVGLVA